MRLVNLTAKGTANPFHGRDSPSTAEPYETDSGWGLVAVGKRAVQSDRHTRTSLTPLMSRKIHTLSQTAAFFSLRAQRPARQTCERVRNFFPEFTLRKRRFARFAPKRRGK